MSAEALSNPAAEWSVVASLLTNPALIPEVVGAQVEAQDFLREDAALLYATTVETYFDDKTVEPLGIAEKTRRALSKMWDMPDAAVPDELLARVGRRDLTGHVLDHAGIVQRLSAARKLLSVTSRAAVALHEGEQTPDEVAGQLSSEALAITGGSTSRTELLDWMDAGREYARYLRRQRLAHQQGIELAVYTGYSWFDNFIKGLAPTELAFIAGAPGAGKSIVGWLLAEGFANRQMNKPAQHRIGTLVVSMEMGLIPSSTRLAQAVSGVDGMRLREGQISDREYVKVLREWKAREGRPIYFNYASNLRLSQLRALVVEGIRRHNVGLVLLDHFRQIDTDRPVDNPNVADEVKVRFLKEQLAKDLNVAVVTIAHTLKLGRAAEGAAVRPRLADLRGSGQIAANADFVGLLYRPSSNLSEEEQLTLNVNRNDAEMLWVKARHAEEGVAYFSLDASTMSAHPR